MSSWSSRSRSPPTPRATRAPAMPRRRPSRHPRRNMSEPPHPLELIDRERVLALLTQHLNSAWASFERPRPKEPELDQELVERLSQGLPIEPGDPEASLADISSVLDA